MSYYDEYFCPNCGAILNDQYGFDPDEGTWTCTNCGQGLMDDDIYEGDTFQGVVWRCDRCNALLNRQFGFSDSLGSWTCTECGHTNGITEDDIYSNESEIIRCPNCNGSLNSQVGFSEYSNDCECSFCGAKLHRDYSCDDFSIIEDEEDDDTDCESIDNYDENEYDDDTDCENIDNYDEDEYDDDLGSSNQSSSFNRDEYLSYSTSTKTRTDSKSETQKFYCPRCSSLLNNQYEFNHKAENHTCKVCHTLLYHYYTDEPYKVKHTRERTSPTNPISNPYTGSPSYKTTNKSSKSNDWYLFFLCLFLGFFGVHKFVEGKVGMGFLYLFTFGLFYIGWFVDIIKYFKRAIT